MRRVLMVMLIATALVLSSAGQASAVGPGDHPAADDHSQSPEHSQDAAHQSDVAAEHRAANGVPNAVCETSGTINGEMTSGNAVYAASITDATTGISVLGVTVNIRPMGTGFEIIIPASELPGTFAVEYRYNDGPMTPTMGMISTSVSCGQILLLTNL
jgi:hypothetical protein